MCPIPDDSCGLKRNCTLWRLSCRWRPGRSCRCRPGRNRSGETSARFASRNPFVRRSIIIPLGVRPVATHAPFVAQRALHNQWPLCAFAAIQPDGRSHSVEQVNMRREFTRVRVHCIHSAGEHREACLQTFPHPPFWDARGYREMCRRYPSLAG